MMKANVAAALAIAALLPLSADAKPPVPIEEVVAIANRSLAERGHKEVYIRNITLSNGPVFSRKEAWIVTWSQPIPGSRPEIKEIGLRIDMNGKVVHLVK